MEFDLILLPEQQAQVQRLSMRDWAAYTESMLGKGLMLPERDNLAPGYLGGFLDDIVNFAIYIHHPSGRHGQIYEVPEASVSVWSQTRQIVETVQHWFNNGTKLGSYRRPGRDVIEYNVQITKPERVASICQEAAPQMVIKQEQALLVWNFLAAKDGFGPDLLSEATYYRDRLRAMKATRMVDRLDLTPAYIAGMFDAGLGSFNISSYIGSNGYPTWGLQLTFNHKSRMLLEGIKQTLGNDENVWDLASDPLKKSRGNKQRMCFNDYTILPFLEYMQQHVFLRLPEVLIAADFLRAQQIFGDTHRDRSSSGIFVPDPPAWAQFKNDVRTNYKTALEAAEQAFFGHRAA